MCKIARNNSGKAAQVIPEYTALQQEACQKLSENLAELQKFTEQELPHTIISQQNAAEGLEQLAKNLKCLVK